MAVPDDRRAAFDAERSRRCDEVFAQHRGLLFDHRVQHGWLTGALGDPFADVWFVAENPSITQMARVNERSPESQWLVSKGDQLFRDMLVKHGFKDTPRDEPGGWRCYITDVVKSADRAGEWANRRARERTATVDAWAPVLAWELEQGRPLLVAAVGKPADHYLTRLERSGAIPRLPARRCIPHYSYVAMRPDRHGRGPGHHERRAEYDAEFEAIASRARELSAGRS